MYNFSLVRERKAEYICISVHNLWLGELVEGLDSFCIFQRNSNRLSKFGMERVRKEKKSEIVV